MGRDFAPFDTRNYETVSVREGYVQWSAVYDATVDDALDLDLLSRLSCILWDELTSVADLACGTGRVGTWLKERRAGQVDGVDLTPEMLRLAETKGTYRTLSLGDMTGCDLAGEAYDAVTNVLASAHIKDLAPLYLEAARLTRPEGWFALVGYHPVFLLAGIPTHFDRPDGRPLAIETYVHMLSEHFAAAAEAGWAFVAFDEHVVGEAICDQRPSYRKHLGKPTSFVLLWRRDRTP
jgi:SAM-dependent methyltransferase